MVGMAGFEPTTTTPQCGALPDAYIPLHYYLSRIEWAYLLLYNIISIVKGIRMSLVESPSLGNLTGVF